MSKKNKWIIALAIIAVGLGVIMFPGWQAHTLCSAKIRADYPGSYVAGYGGDVLGYSQIIRKYHLGAVINGDGMRCLCYVVKSGDTGLWYASTVTCQ